MRTATVHTNPNGPHSGPYAATGAHKTQWSAQRTLRSPCRLDADGASWQIRLNRRNTACVHAADSNIVGRFALKTALSVRSTKRNEVSGCFLWPFFTLFFIAGAVAFYFMTFQPLWGVASSGDWKETPCEVISSEVGVHDGDESDTYSIDIRYKYTVDGRRHVSSRYGFMSGMSSSGYASKKAVVDQYPVGKKSVCFVDPADPKSAVLNRSLTLDMWWGLFPFPFLAVGGGGLFYLISKKFRGGSQKENNQTTPSEVSATQSFQSQSLSPGESDNDEDDDDEIVPTQKADDHVPIELSPETSPGCMFLGTLFAALFWNGIVSVFVYHVITDFEWFLALFLTPFVCVGIFLIGAVVYHGVALFNPRPTLTLDRRSIPLGGTATVSWRFSGNVNAIQRLKLSIRAQEEATYVRGTDTHTDTETIYEDVIVDAQGMMAEVSMGEAEFTIPESAMHSFESDNNEICWDLILHGDIPLRPDVKLEFPIRVRPHEHV